MVSKFVSGSVNFLLLYFEAMNGRTSRIDLNNLRYSKGLSSETLGWFPSLLVDDRRLGLAVKTAIPSEFIILFYTCVTMSKQVPHVSRGTVLLNALLRPIPGTYREAKQVYMCGRRQVYLDRSVKLGPFKIDAHHVKHQMENC